METFFCVYLKNIPTFYTIPFILQNRVKQPLVKNLTSTASQMKHVLLFYYESNFYLTTVGNIRDDDYYIIVCTKTFNQPR